MIENFFDTHCHLDFAVFDEDREEVLKRAQQAGVRHILVPGTQQGNPASAALTRGSQIQLHRAVGLHPYFIQKHEPEHLEKVEEQLEQNQHLLVGEIGLDRTCSAWDQQCELFEQQVKLAARYQRPLILHHRKSQSDLLGILAPYLDDLPTCKGVLHAFSGSEQQAQDWTSKGFLLGVGGTITYERARKTRHAIAQVPLASLVLETDAPDMPLAGRQGKRNEPCHVANVVDALLELRSESRTTVVRALWENSQKLIGFLAADASADSATC